MTNAKVRLQSKSDLPLAVKIFVVGMSLLVSACQTSEEAERVSAPALPPAVEVKQVPTPKPPEDDLSLGPKPNSSPTAKVGERPIPPAQTGLMKNSGPAFVAQSKFPEPDALAGITQQHVNALQARGARGLEWSDSLSKHADLQSRQLIGGMCDMKNTKVLSARGEAIYLAPAGRDAKGQPRLLNVSVKTFVQEVMSAKAGPFGRDDAGATSLGCAISHCSNSNQIWLCRYK